MIPKTTHYSLIALGCLFFLAPLYSEAQNVLWEPISRVEAQSLGKSQIETKVASVQTIDIALLSSFLESAPSGKPFEVKSSNTILSIPMPDGQVMPFKMIESSILSPELAKKLPQVHTYVGQALNDNRIHGRMDITQHGFHAIIFTPEGTVYIDPYQKGNTAYYLVYWKKDFLNSKKAALNESCQVESTKKEAKDQGKNTSTDTQAKDGTAARSSGTELRTYRLAVAATGEYTQFHNDNDDSNGDAIADAQAAIVTTFNRVTGIYEKEVAVSFTLVDNSSIVFDDGTADPFNNNSAGALINESQTVIDNNIGFNNYDVGHTVSTGGGGLAGLGVICTSSKARGITGLGQPIGDPFDVDYVSHEVGHQFGGPHTFNGNIGSCSGGNRSADSAYEPGSGTTIMAYAGICGSQNTQNNSNDYFHTDSYDSILDHTLEGSGNNCPTTTSTGNTPPVVSVPEGGFTIPINTPFALTGSATDADGDELSYSWEQFDLGPAGSPNNPSLDAPIFRSFSPVESPTRIFPRIEDIVNNSQTIGELLPSYTRGLTFRLTARDNQAIGGVDYASIAFSVSNTAGPFLVSSPNTAITWEGGSSQRITWDVANTDKALVNCQTVNILLSLDGGFTYPITLASDVPNDGAHWIAVPNEATTQARIKVEAADNIFFDISNQNFTIDAVSAPTFSLVVDAESATACAPASATYEVSLGSVLGFNEAVTLSTNNLPSELNASFGQNPITPTGSTTLNLSNTTALSTGTYSFEIEASTSEITRTIAVSIEVINGAPAVPILQSPSNGAVNTSESPLFNWADSPGTDKYTIEIATDLSFNAIVLQEDVFSSDFQITSPLEFGTTYYWRVSASSACGDVSLSEVATFTTFSPACFTYSPDDLPITISDGPPNTISSTINVTDDFEITDVSLINTSGTHTWINDLIFTLISPAGTEVILMARPCGNQDNFDIGFDDDAASANYPCPPNDGNIYRPFDNLSAFIGENSVGDWTLSINDAATDDGGSLEAWTLELCTVDDGNTPPVIVQNAALLSSPGETSYTLGSAQLQATDAEDNDDNLTYEIEQIPTQGSLIQNGDALEVGSLFIQSELNSGQISYQPDSENSSLSDSFKFKVNDSGNLSTEQSTFNIFLDYPPVLVTNEPLIDIPGQSSYTIPNSLLEASDEEDNNSLLTFIVTQVPQNGTLEIFGFNVLQGEDFSQNNVNVNVLNYIPNSTSSGSQDSFLFKIRDSAGNETEEFTFTINIDIVNDLEGNPMEIGTEVSPNPSEGIFRVALDFPYQGKVDLEICSIEGKILKNVQIEKETTRTEFALDLSDLSAGVYFLRIQNEESRVIKRLMKR